MIIAAIFFLSSAESTGPSSGHARVASGYIDLQSCVIQLARWTEFSVERFACVSEGGSGLSVRIPPLSLN